jgi:dihydroflavonol-4-reductase
MKVFVTGGTGFIGGHVVRQLIERGDEVVALARSAEKGKALQDLGAEVRIGTLSDRDVLARAMEGCDAVIHGAAIYEVGIPKSKRQPMYAANVEGTENTLGAAKDAGIPRVVYVSTVGAFGNTHGEIVDETYQHPGKDFTSYYEETKYQAHQVAKRFIADGMPLVIVQPGGVYGPDDHSALGKTMLDFVKGRLPMVPFAEVGMNMVHVEDVAAGILLALDKGNEGESYVLGDQITTMRGLLEAAAEVSGRKPPKRDLPVGLMKVIAPLGPVIGPVMGQPPNFRELISSSDGVTFWAKQDKAVAELGFKPRGLKEGLRETLVAEGQIPA